MQQKLNYACFDASGEREVERLELPEYIPTKSGTGTSRTRARESMAIQVHGSHDPAKGHRFNPNKLWLDSHAKAHVGHLELVS
jgi:isoamylase